jgi:hypothetical protein
MHQQQTAQQMHCKRQRSSLLCDGPGPLKASSNQMIHRDKKDCYTLYFFGINEPITLIKQVVPEICRVLKPILAKNA